MAYVQRDGAGALAGLSELQQAVAAGNSALVDELIARGEDVNRITVSPDGRVGTALMTAVAIADPAQRMMMAAKLLRAGADPNALSVGPGNLPINFLLTHVPPGSDPGLEELVRLLMKHGAQPDAGMLDLVQAHSMFGVEYEIRRRSAPDRPVEEPGRTGCCLVPALVILALAGVVIYLVSQYIPLNAPFFGQ